MTPGGQAADPGKLPASGSASCYDDQLCFYVAIDPALPGTAILTGEGQIGTRLHESIERWTGRVRDECDATQILCSFCARKLTVPPHGDREDAMRLHLPNCLDLAGWVG